MDRTTKYILAVKEYMAKAEHATNAEVLNSLRIKYPKLSSTTVHRITSRLYERGELGLAPSGQDNVLRYDVNIKPHDHFMCIKCGMLRDAYLDEKIKPMIEHAIGDGCSISGNLAVSGICKVCNKE